MVFFPVGFGLALHVLFWGMGMACLLTPRPWRRWWPLFCAPFGLALQSAVVWAFAHTELPGANSYARWSELLPLVLALIAVRKSGAARLWAQLAAFRGIGLAMAGLLAMLLIPMAQSSPVLTTSSLGSCDAADYAAGARVFQEFARSDRTGFMGLTDVVSLASVDNFYDFWLRLNHFTPSALIAFNGAALGLVGYQITGLMTALLVVLTVPVVFWLARAGFRYSAPISLWIAIVYALNPLTWYAVAHVAMGQLLAAHGIALLTWAGIALWRGSLTPRRAVTFAGLLVAVWWILLGSYNFIVPIALVPAFAFAGGLAVLRGQWGRLALWIAAVIAPLVLTGIVFAGRVIGLEERYQLLQENDFGWAIPALTPEAWLGGVAGTDLAPAAGIFVRVVLALALVGLFALTLIRRRGVTAFTAASLTIPVVVGYAFLEWRGVQFGTNASYDAYKLLSVFFPGILASLCLWTTLLRPRNEVVRAIAVCGLVAVTLGNGLASVRFMRALARPPLIVEPDLVQLGDLEHRAGIASVNMQIPDMWSRLWANAFLLRMPQYFPTHTYEGRRNTSLRGDWDLFSGAIATNLPANGSVRLNPGYLLVDTRSPYRILVRATDGWYDIEHSAKDGRQWRWTAGEATLVVGNPGNLPMHTNWRLKNVESLVPRQLHVMVNGKPLSGFPIDANGRDVLIPDLVVPPGGLLLSFRTDEPLSRPAGKDTRELGFRIFGIEINVEAAPTTSDGKPSSAAPGSVDSAVLVRAASGQ